MDDKKYSSYEEAYQRESMNKLLKEQEEIETRTKLFNSLNILATILIVFIILTIIVKGLIIFGLIEVASTTL